MRIAQQQKIVILQPVAAFVLFGQHIARQVQTQTAGVVVAPFVVVNFPPVGICLLYTSRCV